MKCKKIHLRRRMYQREVDVDMLNAVKSLLADVSSVSPSSEQRVTEVELPVQYREDCSIKWSLSLTDTPTVILMTSECV